MEKTDYSRREFIATGLAATTGVSIGLSALNAAHAARIPGANERIRMGFIGVGNRGSQLMQLFMAQPDVEIAALCDVYQPYTARDRSAVEPRYIKDMDGQIPRMGEKFSKPPLHFEDYRKLLEQKDIDAVCIATPDHWHALQTIDAIRAGKDVYVEKPLTITIAEGRKMVEAQQGSSQVVAVGLNRRGAPVYQKLAKEIPSGKIGKVTVARAFRINNMFPDGIGKSGPEMPPQVSNGISGLDHAP